ncbi:hypothetical protein [Fimbriiglobus ruber]|nr:hypothetical protein [Fimbriiglobus ruber]
MIRKLMYAQLSMFLFYGLVSGAAITLLIHYKCRQAEASATAAVLLQLSPRALSEVTI